MTTRRRFARPIAFALALAIVLVACRAPDAVPPGGANPGPDTEVALPASATSLNVGTSTRLTADVRGVEPGAVVWTTTCGRFEGPARGTTTTYVAPDAPERCRVVATAGGDARADLVVTVLPEGATIDVAMVPRSASVPTGGDVRVRATVDGAPEAGVVWSASCGTVDAEAGVGTYRAPETEATCTVRAASAADPARAATTTLAVRAFPGTLAVAPAEVVVGPGDVVDFTARWAVVGVAQVSPADLTWRATCGDVTGAGRTARYVAPEVGGPCDVQVAAPSPTDATATARVTIRPPVVVTVSPQDAALGVGEVLGLRANVSGAPGGDVRWSATCGTVDAAERRATFVAPDAPATCVVRAEAGDDASDVGTATLRVVDRETPSDTDAAPVRPSPTDPSPDVPARFDVTPDALDLVVGDAAPLAATFGETSPADVTITWTSQDPTIARVDAWGRVTGLAEGTTRVRAAANTVPSRTDSVPVRVAAHGACPDLEAEVAVPDAVLRAAIVERIGAPLTCARMLTLQHLSVWSQDVGDLSGLEAARNLERLVVGFTDVTDLGPVASLTDLRFLRLTAAPVSDLSPLRGLERLEELDVGQTSVTDLSPLAGAERLRVFKAFRAPVADLSPLAGATSLERLDLHLTRVHDLTPLANATALRRASFTFTDVADVGPLANAVDLTYLDLTGTRVTDLRPLAGLTRLETLEVGASDVEDVSMLGGLTNLTRLHLGSSEVADVSVVANFVDLEMLQLAYTDVADVTPLSSLRNLEYLGLNNTPRLRNVRPLARLDRVERLYLGGSAVTDLSGLEGMTSVQRLHLDLIPELRDVTPLAAMPSLTNVGLSGTGVVNLAPLVEGPGLGEGDYVNLSNTPLDTSEGSPAALAIERLERRGVHVSY
ncbi:MAG: Ig-like domain-containing protein [Trueperaceae bacterium]|nr:Ig-like domain-containing protein [Trueperaceae bacterium]